VGLIWRKRVRVDHDTDANLSKSGASLSHRVGRRLRLNSRAGGSFRLLRGMSWRSAGAADGTAQRVQQLKPDRQVPIAMRTPASAGDGPDRPQVVRLTGWRP
jgi:hypothetical protein